MPRLLRIQGQPTFLLGVNYWSRAGGPRMWERFDPAAVRRELQQMRDIGLNTCRSFAFIPTFMPQPPAVDAAALARFGEFLELCRDAGVATIPSFLVGHMSGENFDFPGQLGRSLYTDAELLSWQEALVREIGGVGASHAAVVAYLASNEMPLWAGDADPSTVAAWARALRAALHERDPQRPFGTGDGVMNLKGGQNGFDPQALGEAIDFVGPHTYQVDADPLRQAYTAELCLRSLTHLGRPVILEEFGTTSARVSDENQALYYREVLHACLSVGAAGALGWCYSDFDLADERPYQHHAFELTFGVTRADGSEKPVCDELRRISALVAAIDYPALRHPRPRAAILVPSYFNTAHPFSTEDRERMRRVLLQCYALCAGAGIEVELVPEAADLGPYRLVLCPSTQKLLATTWRDLVLHARRGNTVYWSYFSGDFAFHHCQWCHNFEELTGCRHLLRHGCLDLPEEVAAIDGVGLRLRTRWPTGKAYPSSCAPIAPWSAEVLARDGRGQPALTRVVHGAGQVLFLNQPWEYYLSEQVGGTDDGTSFQLYRLLADRAGLRPALRASEPEVQLRLVESDAGSLLWVINHAWRSLEVEIESPGGVAIYGGDLHLGDGSSRLPLAPKQVAVFRLVR
jgi:endo-1,4-beta-mannosidase